MNIEIKRKLLFDYEQHLKKEKVSSGRIDNRLIGFAYAVDILEKEYEDKKSAKEELGEIFEEQHKTILKMKKGECQNCKHCYSTPNGDYFSCNLEMYFCDFGYTCEKFEERIVE